MLRLRLFQVVKEIYSVSDIELYRILPDPNQLFAHIMGSQDKQIVHAVSDFVWDAFCVCEKMLFDRG